MIKLYFAPRTRSVRILWLLEELGLPYELERVEFEPPAKRFFGQQTPTGGTVLPCHSKTRRPSLLSNHRSVSLPLKQLTADNRAGTGRDTHTRSCH